jgi:hypothetical protein
MLLKRRLAATRTAISLFDIVFCLKLSSQRGSLKKTASNFIVKFSETQKKLFHFSSNVPVPVLYWSHVPVWADGQNLSYDCHPLQLQLLRMDTGNILFCKL